MNELDRVAKELGFLSFQELNNMTAQIDISTPERMAAFNEWKLNDGTKYGLLCLYAAHGQEPPRPYATG